LVLGGRQARAREKMEDICGTVWYYAPEIVNVRPYTPLVDEWALGVSMYLLFSGRFPFDAEDDDEEEVCLLIAAAEVDVSGQCGHRPTPIAISIGPPHPAFSSPPLALPRAVGGR
jgi:serine/threonine protein kinase